MTQLHLQPQGCGQRFIAGDAFYAGVSLATGSVRESRNRYTESTKKIGRCQMCLEQRLQKGLAPDRRRWYREKRM